MAESVSEFYYMLAVYVPESHCDMVKDALFDAGAGRVGAYDRCAWETAGRGQYRPLPGSEPYAGETGTVERAAEMKVETVCHARFIDGVIQALRQAHPYETPAFHYWRVYGITEEA